MQLHLETHGTRYIELNNRLAVVPVWRHNLFTDEASVLAEEQHARLRFKVKESKRLDQNGTVEFEIDRTARRIVIGISCVSVFRDDQNIIEIVCRQIVIATRRVVRVKDHRLIFTGRRACSHDPNANVAVLVCYSFAGCEAVEIYCSDHVICS